MEYNLWTTITGRTAQALENPWLILLGGLILSLLAYWIIRWILRRPIRHLIERSTTALDDTLMEKSVFNRLILLVPLMVFYNFTRFAPGLEEFLNRILLALAVLVVLLTFSAFMTVIHEVSRQFDTTRRLGIKSYIQTVKLVVFILGGVAILAILMGRSPWVMLSGVGALTAVLLLIFRDTILSFVASIQISANDLVRIGDWIEMPTYNTDGEVTDIALHTVKVRNWDNTISTIPTYKLMDAAMKNWRGMSQSGGRRIKRAIHIDVASIKLCDEALLHRLAGIRLIGGYVQQKRQEIAEHNRKVGIDQRHPINSRQLTNVGTFRAYIEAYLKSHPRVHQDMTLLVRQLPPGDNGLPLEIYCFTNDTRWGEYEAIQADIFDHLMAVVTAFDLKLFQRPTGADFKRLVR